jgi:hypothetical protein
MNRNVFGGVENVMDKKNVFRSRKPFPFKKKSSPAAGEYLNEMKTYALSVRGGVEFFTERVCCEHQRVEGMVVSGKGWKVRTSPGAPYCFAASERRFFCLRGGERTKGVRDELPDGACVWHKKSDVSRSHDDLSCEPNSSCGRPLFLYKNERSFTK